MYPESPLYNEPIMVQLGEPVDALVLTSVLTEITRRHEAWRTTFTTIDGVPAQRIHPPRAFDLPIINLSNLPPEERDSEAMRLAVADARRPFDLEAGPLVRGLLLRVSDTDVRLIVTAHHIVVDGVSFFNVFLPELSALYAAYSRGRPSPLPDLPVQYADFAVWQRRWLTEEALAPSLAHWRSHMAGMTELGVRTDHERPAQLERRGARASVTLPAELMRSLRELARRTGTTLFTTVLAAWKTLLFRYTGQTDIVVGSAAAGRPRPEVDALIGYFNNNLVLRTHLDGAMSFLSLVTRVGEVLKGARDHQYVPFDRLISELHADRSLNKSPIYNNVFILMPPLSPLEETPRMQASRFDIGTAKVDLYLELHQRASGLVGHIEYQTELFSPDTIARMIGHLTTLLHGIVRDPEQRLVDLPLLTESEQRQISIFRGPHAAPAPDGELASLEQRFEAQAARSPAAIAVEHGSFRLTYAELNARANQLARHLRAQGVGPETLVGLCVERSFDAMVGILGVLKAGGAYVPLDPGYPAERLRFILEDTKISLSLTTRKHAALAQQHGVRAILLDDDWPAIAKHSADNPAPVAAAGNVAYVIYTSGSTGRPKGVLVERRGLSHLARAQERMFGLGVGSRVLSFFSLNFDGSVWEMSMTWPVGATLVLADQEALLPGAGLAKLLKERELHVAAIPPSALAVTPYTELPALHTLIVVGEAVPEELVNRWAPGRRFFNGYGPTETTVVCVIAECHAGAGKPLIGRPFEFVEAHILDSAMRPVPVGVPGELYIGGPGVARGYLDRPELTTVRFIDSPTSDNAGARLYKTGDLVRWRPDGSIDYLGRVDRQIKLRGYRIELGEVEAVLSSHPAVQQAVATVWERGPSDRLLLAYVRLREDQGDLAPAELVAWLRQRLPSYMVPSAVVPIDEVPLLPSGKVDVHALPAPDTLSSGISAAPRAPSSTIEHEIMRIWQEVLHRDQIGAHDNFFDVGGHSLLLASVHDRISRDLHREIPMVRLFEHPTVSALVRYLEEGQNGRARQRPEADRAPLAASHARGRKGAAQASTTASSGIAIIGMSGRFPGARSVAQLWRNLCAGIDSITFYSRRELLLAGVPPALADDPSYVPAHGRLDDIASFDADFFGLSAREAEITDPQHRLLLEHAWEALEDAGYEPRRTQGAVGVFVGSGPEQYLYQNVLPNREVREIVGDYSLNLANNRDFLATRLAYKLDLRGPSLTIQTACSTSLVAVTMACENLLDRRCDIALAGGVSINLAIQHGYIHRRGMVLSRHGRCRTFDANADGIVGGDGVGVVVLKRLEDALADGDTIHAVIKGASLTNDGAGKVGYTAPSVQGQSQAIAQALEMAGFDPETVTYVEAHGTGTELGDPIEIAALNEVFGRSGAPRQAIALGALKTNIGHLDAAAGIAGLIKATLSIEHRKLPPTLHYEAPNPNIDLANSPFHVNAALTEWSPPGPRRAGVSAFGIGGTNAHVVLEEAPAVRAAPSPRGTELLILSARTPAALDAASANLAAHLAERRDLALSDVAYTLQVGRRAFAHRRAVVCRDRDEAVRALRSPELPAVVTRGPVPEERSVVFLFPGQGSQFVGMGRAIYEGEPTFRAWVDRSAEILRPELGRDLRDILYPSEAEAGRAAEDLRQTIFTQPALFVIEYALAKLWMEQGVEPVAMLGHSIGEYVAACLAGVFELPDALSLVAQRGRLMQSLPVGSMIAVPLSEAEARARCGDALALAAVNGPSVSVIAGPTSAIDALVQDLSRDGIHASRLRTSHAFHSPMVDPILPAFERCVASVRLHAPKLPYLSNVTGTWADAAEVTRPAYWARHLRGTVRFSDGLAALFQDRDRTLFEVGPGEAIAAMVARHPDRPEGQRVVSALPRPRDGESPGSPMLEAMRDLWLSGVEIDWRRVHARDHRRRVSLPTYPFERRRFWISPPRVSEARVEASATPAPDVRRDPSRWLYQPVWRAASWPRREALAHGGARRVLVLADGGDVAESIVTALRARGDDVTIARPGAAFDESPSEGFTIQPGSADQHRSLVQRLAATGRLPDDIVHLWSVGPDGAGGSALDRLEEQEDRGFYSLVFLAQALARDGAQKPVRVAIVTSGVYSVEGEPVTHPERAMALGPCLVIPREIDFISCRCIDLDTAGERTAGVDAARNVLAELDDPEGEAIVAHRRGRRYHRAFERVAPPDAARAQLLLRQRGVYLITGGLGGIGLTLAKHLARAASARLVLTTRDMSRDKDDRARHIREIQALGGEVLVVEADVASRDQMLACVREAEARFGEIHGVIHAAGLMGGGAIAGQTAAQAARTLAPKVRGTLVLSDVLGERDLDFFVLCSSLAALMGAFGQVDYAAANAFQDAFAHHPRRRGAATITSIDWDGWKEVGMSGRAAASHESALSPAEGTEAFALSLASGLTQVVVSTLDLEARLKSATTARASSAQDQAPGRSPRAARHVAPESDTERTLAEIWGRFFGADQIGTADDFFSDLGGDSLMAVHLLTLVSAELKVELPVNSLLAAPTVAALARDIEARAQAQRIAAADVSSPLPLVELQRGTSGPPLFLVHPIGGLVYIYRDLVSLLDKDCQVYGIEAPGLDGKSEPLRSAQEMAARYVAALRARQPEGPYRLGGSSFGGTLAYEMAQLLVAQGQEVDFVAMIDGANPGALHWLPKSDTEIVDYMLEVGALDESLADGLHKMPPEERLSRFLRHTGEKGRFIPPLPPEQMQRFFEVWRIGLKVMSVYAPDPCPCPILFFRPLERHVSGPGMPEQVWREFARGRFDLFDVPGNHITMNYAPHVKRVAEVISARMAR